MAVIHRVYTSSALSPGEQQSTAEVEAELMELWSGVEKDRDAETARRAAHEAAAEERATRVAPLASLGGGGGGGGWSGGWARLDGSGAEDEEGEGGSGQPAKKGGAQGEADVEEEEGAGGTALAWLPDVQEERRSRAASTEPWTARQTVAGQRGFWSTLGDMLLDIYIVARGPERRALRTACWLAFFNQAVASTAIINYAPTLMREAGLRSASAASLLTAAVGGSKLVGVSLAFLLVDSLGRRPLLLGGSLGCAAALGALVAADALSSVPFLLAGMCCFVLAFSISWAGVFWVLLSEFFSMSVKSPAAAAATSVLFLTGAVSNLLFLSLRSWLGPWSFLVYCLIALASAGYVYWAVPETKGRSLPEVQQLLAYGRHGAPRATQDSLSDAGVELPARGFGRDGWRRIWR